MNAQKLYNKISAEAKGGAKILTVFDLDSTLYDVSPRTERILQDFATLESHPAHFLPSLEILKKVKLTRQDWGYQEALHRISDITHVPDFHDQVHKHWVLHFFGNHYLRYDQPYEGALHFVRALHQQKIEIAYLTGRDVARMGPGTEQVLRNSGFPLDSHAQLHLKAHKSLDDAEFKRDWFKKEITLFDHIYFFENEPVNIDLIAKDFPQVTIVFFDSTHSNKMPSPANFITLQNYKIESA